RGPVLASIWEGRDAVAVVRRLVGPTDCGDAEPGTIRGDFGVDFRENLVHASDSVEAARREIALFFD
ncbi:MAG: nucleoside-diphosphate kinase, partial [Thermoguttaceae bacterium]|nr:nucleoside-diphosphate kinase [Thermoguttaceae bacterium]